MRASGARPGRPGYGKLFLQFVIAGAWSAGITHAAPPRIKPPAGQNLAGIPRSALLLRAAVVSNVTADSTLNTAVTHNGSTFIITGGTTQRTNLFQSLSTLDLAAGDTARFVANPNVTNILARITGAQSSTIDGTIQTRLSTDAAAVHPANLFLINPAGILFGPDAAIDLGGAFAVTTADFVRLKDGTQFNSAATANPILRTSNAAAFGFVNPHPATITVAGTQFTMPAGHPLSLIGGDTAISGGTLATSAGRVNLVSVAGAGEARLDATDLAAAPPDVSDFAKLGTINLDAGSVVNVDNPTGAGGSVYVRAGSLNLSGSQIASRSLGGSIGEKGGLIDIDVSHSVLLIGDDVSGTPSVVKSITAGDASGGDISVAAKDVLLLSNSAFSTSTSGAGAGGAISISAAKTLRLDDLGTGSIAYITTFAGDTDPTIASGAGGPIRLNAGTLAIHGAGAALYTQTTTNAPGGHGGSITGNIQTITIAGAGSLETDTYAGAPGGDIRLRSKRMNIVSGGTLLTNSYAGGAGGSVVLTTDALSLGGGGNLFTTTQSTGTGGSIHIDAKSIQMTDPDTDLGTSTQSVGSLAGAAGNLWINSDQIDIHNLAKISNIAFGDSRTGDMHIHANELDVVGLHSSKIHANTGIILGTASGSNGDMKISVGTLTLKNGAISGTNDTAAPGGVVLVHAKNEIAMDGPYSIMSTSVASQGTGHGGNLLLTSPIVHVTGGAQLLVGTIGPAPAGSLRIDTGTGGAVLFDGLHSGIGAQTVGVASTATAGTVNIRSDTVTLRNNAVIFASAFGLGNGGDVRINAGTLSINGGAAVSVATEANGNGGSARLTARQINLFNAGEVDAVATGAGNGGQVVLSADRINMDSAGHLTSQASGTGKAGDVTVNGELRMNGQSFISSAAITDGGNITVNTKGDVLLRDSRLFAAANNGGDIHLYVQSPGRVVLDRSFVSARAVNKGGTVTIDPRVVALSDHSIIDGLAGTQPQPVTIVADGLLISNDSFILTTVPNFHPNLDLAKNLGHLNADVGTGGITLDDRCTSSAVGAGWSSFVVTGKGGTAVEPMDWLPSYLLPPTSTQPVKE